jgi:hypothetical protein
MLLRSSLPLSNAVCGISVRALPFLLTDTRRCQVPQSQFNMQFSPSSVATPSGSCLLSLPIVYTL